jgi:hypothetical protein
MMKLDKIRYLVSLSDFVCFVWEEATTFVEVVVPEKSSTNDLVRKLALQLHKHPKKMFRNQLHNWMLV